MQDSLFEHFQRQWAQSGNDQWRMQDFPDGDSNLQGGTPTYYLAKISTKSA